MNSKNIVKDLGKHDFKGKVVKSVYISNHVFFIRFEDGDHIQIQTNDEPLEYDANHE